MLQYGHTFAVFVVGLSLTAGCVAKLPTSSSLPEDPERLAIDIAISAWHRAGFEWSELCSEEYPKIHIVVSEPDEFTRLCRRRPSSAGGNLYACHTEQNEFLFPGWVFRNTQVPLLVISALQPETHRRLLVIHETMHWLEKCSGKGIDFNHADKRVWEGANIEGQRMYLNRQLNP